MEAGQPTMDFMCWATNIPIEWLINPKNIRRRMIVRRQSKMSKSNHLQAGKTITPLETLGLYRAFA